MQEFWKMNAVTNWRQWLRSQPNLPADVDYEDSINSDDSESEPDSGDIDNRSNFKNIC